MRLSDYELLLLLREFEDRALPIYQLPDMDQSALIRDALQELVELRKGSISHVPVDDFVQAMRDAVPHRNMVQLKFTRTDNTSGDTFIKVIDEMSGETLWSESANFWNYDDVHDRALDAADKARADIIVSELNRILKEKKQ